MIVKGLLLLSSYYQGNMNAILTLSLDFLMHRFAYPQHIRNLYFLCLATLATEDYFLTTKRVK